MDAEAGCLRHGGILVGAKKPPADTGGSLFDEYRMLVYCRLTGITT